MNSTVQERRARILEGIEAVPPFPDVATRVLEMARDDDTGVADLARAVSRDPGLTAAVLRAANSAAFGGSREMSSLPDGILRLGVRHVRDIVVAACLPASSQSSVHPRMRDLWTHAVSSALAVRALCVSVQAPDPEIGFLAGLFHDLGQQHILVTHPKDYAEILGEGKSEDRTIERERVRFGIDHAETGALLLESWDFDDSLCAVAFHHHDDAASLEGLALFTTAVDELLGSPLWDSEPVVPPAPVKPPGPAFARLGLDQEELSTFVRRIRTTVDREIRFFGTAP